MKSKIRFEKKYAWRTTPAVYQELEKMAESKYLSVNQQLNVIVMSAILINDSITKRKEK